MYCPTCGLEHLEARRFCNRCGTNLEVISRTLSGSPADPLAAEKLEKRRQAMSRAFLVFCAGPVFGLFMVIVSQILQAVEDYAASNIVENVALFGPLLMLIGVMMMLHVFVVYGRKKRLVQPAPPPQPLSDAGARPLIQSPPPVVTPPLTPPSVTENTTFRLETQAGLTPDAGSRPTAEEEAPRSRQPAKEHP
jgi:hypothetical protein